MRKLLAGLALLAGLTFSSVAPANAQPYYHHYYRHHRRHHVTVIIHR